MKLRVDAELCTGHGRCYELAPDLFGEDARGHCVILRARVPPELETEARLGETSCPERAIHTEDE